MKNIKMIKSTRVFLAYCFAVFVLLLSDHSHAEYFGMLSGRSADISVAPDKSVEAGFVTGDLADVSYQNIGVRFNIRAAPKTMLYLDISQAELEDADGTILGLGFFHELNDVLQNSDLALKGSFHSGEVEEGRFSADGDILAIEALFSGKNLGKSELRWYGNIGIHKFDIDGYDETEIGFGGGVFMPTSFGEFFAGVDLIDEMTFGGGIRYFLQ